MQVERDDAIGSGRLDRIGADSGANRDARLVLLISFRVAEVRHHDCDRVGARAAERVDPEEQLHEVRVRGKDGRLHDVDAAAAHVLEHADEERSFGEAQHFPAP